MAQTANHWEFRNTREEREEREAGEEVRRYRWVTQALKEGRQPQH